MAAKSICDGCGKEAPMVAGADGNWYKPGDWFERSDGDGIQTACCRECIEKIVVQNLYYGWKRAWNMR